MDCASTVARTEGMRAFYLSLPVTLFMNIPYGCVMVASNESFKRMISPSGEARRRDRSFHVPHASTRG